ncbi:MAG: hypothetical protein NQ127_01200 [Candidatus Cardinium sp.]|nr:hypothetical protein [Candidatus Cardinium sp.]
MAIAYHDALDTRTKEGPLKYTFEVLGGIYVAMTVTAMVCFAFQIFEGDSVMENQENRTLLDFKRETIEAYVREAKTYGANDQYERLDTAREKLKNFTEKLMKKLVDWRKKNKHIPDDLRKKLRDLRSVKEDLRSVGETCGPTLESCFLQLDSIDWPGFIGKEPSRTSSPLGESTQSSSQTNLAFSGGEESLKPSTSQQREQSLLPRTSSGELRLSPAQLNLPYTREEESLTPTSQQQEQILLKTQF